MVSESFTLNIISSYINDITINHYGISKDKSAFYAGLISGIYNISVFISSIPIGYLSDRFGKNFFMLLGLFVLSICNLTFTMTTNISIAIMIRGIAGLFNTNDSLCKAVIADEVQNSNKRQFILGLIAFGFQFIKSLSVIIGSVSVNTIIFGYNNPYFLPEFIGTVVDLTLFMTLLATMIYKSYYKPYILLNTTDDIKGDIEMVERIEITTSPTYNTKWCSNFKTTVVASFRNHTIRTLFIINFIQNLVSNGLLFLFTLLINGDKGGFNLTIIQSGLVLGLYSFICFPLQYIINNIKHNSPDEKYNKFYMGTILSIIGCFLLGVIPYLLNVGFVIYSWIALVLYLFCSSVGYMSSVPIITTLIMDATDKHIKQHQGTVQGISRSLVAVSKGIGPILFSWIFNVLGDYKIIFNFCLAILYGFSCFLMHRASRPITLGNN